ncbi:hypothetical protein EJB05_01114, partial [Eragrostis curvula]
MVGKGGVMRTVQLLYQKATGKRSAEGSGSGRSRMKSRGSRRGGRRRGRGSRAPSPSPSVHESEEEEEEEVRGQDASEEPQQQEASEEEHEASEDGDGGGGRRRGGGGGGGRTTRRTGRRTVRLGTCRRCGSAVLHDSHRDRSLLRDARWGWETIVPGDHKRLPAGILGLLCKAHFPGMVPLRDGGEEPALTWAHYKRVPDVPDEDGRDFRTVADRVVGELWDFFRVEPEYRDRAVRWACDACPKLVTDMHHEARVQAVRSYYAKFLGTKIDKKQARTIWPSEEEYRKVIPWWCAAHKPCWDYFVARWCDPEWQKQHEACRERRLKMPGPAHHQGNRTLDDYAASWSQAHDGRECPPLMAWALAHKGKASSSTVDYNPEDGPEAYSNPTVHARLRQYTEMAREKHGPEWNPSTKDLDGEIIMRLGEGKKHGRYWIGDSTLDTASTPTLSEIRARSSSSTPPIRPRPSAAQLQFEQSQTQLREEMEAKLQEQEKRHRAEMQRQQEEMQERDARMQVEMQRQMQMMLHQWHNNGMLPPPLPLPPIGTPSPTQGTPNISAGSNNQPVSPPAAWSPFPPYPRPPPI